MTARAIVGEKVGMTQVWDEQHRLVPVTVLKVTPARVVQVKTPDVDGYAAVQVTYGMQKPQRLTKPEVGHFAKAGVDPGKKVLELRLDDVSSFTVGDTISADIFEAGARVDVTSVSKGKGFAGTMKRHNFKGQGASHGNHKHHRAPGSIGACATPGRVFRGTKMSGRMGGDKTTTLNLTVVQADAERDLLLVKGAVPGARGSTVVIRSAVKARR
ncbi:MAG: 50S ribosomal protein L3 [Acidimicrobiales bacterium]